MPVVRPTLVVRDDGHKTPVRRWEYLPFALVTCWEVTLLSTLLTVLLPSLGVRIVATLQRAFLGCSLKERTDTGSINVLAGCGVSCKCD